MPTSNPRLSITVTPELSAVIERLCILLGHSKSAFLADLLHSSLPVFERMIQALEAAKLLQDEARNAPNEFKASMKAGQERIEEQLGLALDTMDDAFRPLLKESEKVIRRAKAGSATGAAGALPGGPKKGSTPRPVTRGLGRGKTTENRTVKGGKSA
jgi:hypothetical protein